MFCRATRPRLPNATPRSSALALHLVYKKHCTCRQLDREPVATIVIVMQAWRSFPRDCSRRTNRGYDAVAGQLPRDRHMHRHKSAQPAINQARAIQIILSGPQYFTPFPLTGSNILQASNTFVFKTRRSPAAACLFFPCAKFYYLVFKT